MSLGSRLAGRHCGCHVRLTDWRKNGALSQTHEDRQGLMGQMERTNVCTTEKRLVGALVSTAWQRSPPSDRLYVSYLCVCLEGGWISATLHTLPCVSPCDCGQHHACELLSVRRGGRLEGEWGQEELRGKIVEHGIVNSDLHDKRREYVAC